MKNLIQHRSYRLVFLVLCLVGSVFNLRAQDITVPISDGGVVESTNCDNSITVTDSNDGANGNYLPNELYQMTVCFNTLVGDSIQIAVIPQTNGNDTINQWLVDGNSSLSVFEGEDTNGDLLGVFNTETDPDGFYLTTTVPCVTLVWESGATSSAPGFVAQFNCLQDLQPFGVQVLIAPPFGLFEDTIPQIGPDENVIALCFGDTLNFTANPFFPLSDATGDGYLQLAEECTYSWDMGNGDVFEDVGLNTLEYGYPDPGGYFATLTVTDIMGQSEMFTAYILHAPRPIFSNDIFANNLCLGDTTIITGGLTVEDTVGVGPNTSFVFPNFDFTDSRFLPDGNGELYTTTIEIEGFSDDPLITDSEDFLGVCIEIEHSYLGDLEAWLTCPNGQSALLFDAYAGGPGLYIDGQVGFPGATNTFLGDANDPSSDPGIGFEYCFSDDGSLGSFEAEFAAGNTTPVNSFGGGGNAMVAGTYLPAEDFETAFAGCPVNGEWTLNVADNIGSDDGWIFQWSMEFNPEFDIDTIFYTPELDTTFWEMNDDILSELSTDTSVTIVPQATGSNIYTFVVEDNFGCVHREPFDIFVRLLPEIAADPACLLVDSLIPTNSPDGGVFDILTNPDGETLTFADEPNNQGFYQVNASNFGIFEVQFTEQFCGVENDVAVYRDVAQMDFRPIPVIQPFFEDTVLCGGATIFYDANEELQGENDDNFIINWKFGVNGPSINSEDYAVTIDQPGLLILTIDEPACPGVVSDTSLVQAFEINFNGDTICDLQPRVLSVDISPQRATPGMWTSDNLDNLTISNPTFPGTDVFASDFGNYLITYTSPTCPDDALSRNFLWFQQPDINILPENPIFCFEDDSLILLADLVGAGNGSYAWRIFENNTMSVPIIDELAGDEIQEFPPQFFDPLLNYVAIATTRDEFNRCINPGVDTLLFSPLACEYNVPNIITPNGDNRNDLFAIQFIENFPDVSLAIFNRWGQEVFSNTDYGLYQRERGGWNPEDLAGGVYVYELKLPSIDVIETGNITIVTEGGGTQ